MMQAGFGGQMITPDSAQDEGVRSGETRRKRKALSCYECRRRKLRCDRLSPSCTRCRKSGTTNSCQYETRVPRSEGSRREQSPDARYSTVGAENGRELDLMQTIREQSAKIESLEAKLRRLQLQDNAPHQSSEVDSGHANETLFHRGKGFKIQYFGPTKAARILVQMPELHISMKQIWMNNPQLSQARNSFDTAKQKWKDYARKSANSSEQDLFSLVPDRPSMDLIVQQYFKTIELTHRILHGPSFWLEYERYWCGEHEAKSEFAVIMLLVSACTLVQMHKEPWGFIGANSIARERAAKQVEAAESWMAKQSQKHVRLATFQIRTLIVLAKSLNEIKTKQTWVVTGTLLRQAMAAGMHRDPKELAYKRFGYKSNLIKDPTLPGGGLSPFDQEMRRRLWMTIVELDLQASFERGMPCSTTGYSVNCDAPLNIDDGEVSPTVESLPNGRDGDCFTSMWYQHTSYRSLSLRTRINTLLNDTSINMALEETLQLEKSIYEQIDLLTPLRQLDATCTGAEKSALLSRSLVELQLRTLLLMVHDYSIYKESLNRRYSAFESINNACAILDLHEELHSNGYYFVSSLRNDVFRSAMSLCYNMHALNSLQTGSQRQLMPISLGVQYIEKAQRLLYDKTCRAGTAVREQGVIYCVSAYTKLLGDLSDQNVVLQLCKVLRLIVENQDQEYERQMTKDTATSGDDGHPVGSLPLQVQTNATAEGPQIFNMDPNYVDGGDIWDLNSTDFWSIDLSDFF